MGCPMQWFAGGQPLGMLLKQLSACAPRRHPPAHGGCTVPAAGGDHPGASKQRRPAQQGMCVSSMRTAWNLHSPGACCSFRWNASGRSVPGLI